MSGVFVKVDYEKAYDSVDWEFLYYIMDILGFNGRQIRWIRACLESVSVLVLVNGSCHVQNLFYTYIHGLCYKIINTYSWIFILKEITLLRFELF